MDVAATLAVDRSADEVFAWVEDLALYPRWLSIVPKAVPATPADDGQACWDIELRGRIGPLARSKRLRMCRTRHVPSQCAVFERKELDGRSHSLWRLRADLTPIVLDDGRPGCELSMALHYGGGLWVPLLDRLLLEEIERSRPRLAELVRSGPPTR